MIEIVVKYTVVDQKTISQIMKITIQTLQVS
jgi:hypothetical protein